VDEFRDERDLCKLREIGRSSLSPATWPWQCCSVGRLHLHGRANGHAGQGCSYSHSSGGLALGIAPDLDLDTVGYAVNDNERSARFQAWLAEP